MEEAKGLEAEQMRKFLAFAAPAALATAFAAVAIPAISASRNAAPAARLWQIGPVIGSKNYSPGMPQQPTIGRQGWHFDFPYPDARAGHVHYVTFPHGSLDEKSMIRMHYRIETGPGTRFTAQQFPQQRATLALYFQRRGDNWSARGRYQFYRWYAPATTILALSPGEHEVTVRLDDNWRSVLGRTASQEPGAFRDARNDAGRVGFVLGSGGGLGHGVYATSPARLTVTSFTISDRPHRKFYPGVRKCPLQIVDGGLIGP